jgi:hypothetical protein
MSPVSRAWEVNGRVRTDDGFEFDAVVANSRASTSISIESNIIVRSRHTSWLPVLDLCMSWSWCHQNRLKVANQPFHKRPHHAQLVSKS